MNSAFYSLSASLSFVSQGNKPYSPSSGQTFQQQSLKSRHTKGVYPFKEKPTELCCPYNLRNNLDMYKFWSYKTVITNENKIRQCIQKFPDWVDKYTLTKINIRWEATQRDTEAKLTRLTHKLAIQLHLVTGILTIGSSRSRRPVRKLLDLPSYFISYCKCKLLLCH